MVGLTAALTCRRPMRR